MARPRYPQAGQPLPPPLPPATRTVGQLVAESIRIYGSRFLAILPLGLPIAVADLAASGASAAGKVFVLLAFAPVFSAAYALAAGIVGGRRPTLRRWLLAVGVGTLVFVPAALTLPWFALLALAWLALAGLVVPVLVHEAVTPAGALRRALVLGRADYVHALGSLATLVIVFVLTRIALAFLLREQADHAVRAAVFLADVVVSPLLYLGAALLYVDQAARVGSRPRRKER